MEILIVKTTRSKDTLIPKKLLRDDEVLVNGIYQYCNKNNLNPIYIDECVAVFDDHLLIASYKEEL